MSQNDFMQVKEIAIDDILDLDFRGFDQGNHIQVGDKAESGKKRRGEGFYFTQHTR